jgi:hypothetical protein
MNKITDFYSTANKKPRLNEVTLKTKIPESSTSTAGTSEMATTTSNDWPSCWSLEQKNYFCTKYEWLHVSNRKTWLYVLSKGQNSWCCKKKAGTKISKECPNNEVSYNSENQALQPRSLRKKFVITKKVQAIKLL